MSSFCVTGEEEEREKQGTQARRCRAPRSRHFSSTLSNWCRWIPVGPTQPSLRSGAAPFPGLSSYKLASNHWWAQPGKYGKPPVPPKAGDTSHFAPLLTYLYTRVVDRMSFFVPFALGFLSTKAAEGGLVDLVLCVFLLFFFWSVSSRVSIPQ